MPKYTGTETIAYRSLEWKDENKFTFLWNSELVIVYTSDKHTNDTRGTIISHHEPEILEEILIWLSSNWKELPLKGKDEQEDE